MECLNREGKDKCTWWLTGCINPAVPADVKKACGETFGKLPHKVVVKICS